MLDYKQSKIYMIEPTCEYETGEVYYGATTQTLSKRMVGHRNKSKCKSNILFEKYGKENVKIVLVKLFPCNSKSELDAEEAKFIRENKCVNKFIPLRTQKEWNNDNAERNRVRKAEYYKAHLERIKAQRAEFRKANAELIRVRNAEYRKANVELIRVRNTEYYKANADARNEYQRQYNQRKKRSRSV